MWKIVLQIMDLSRTNAKINLQFKSFLEEQNDETDELPSDFSLWSVLRRISIYNVLSHFVKFPNQILTFLRGKGKNIQN